MRYPDRITLIRGNHESRQITQVWIRTCITTLQKLIISTRFTGSMTSACASMAASRYWIFLQNPFSKISFRKDEGINQRYVGQLLTVMQVWRYCTEIFDYLSLSAIIDGKIFCVHGGLSPSIQTLDQIRSAYNLSQISSIVVCDSLSNFQLQDNWSKAGGASRWSHVRSPLVWPRRHSRVKLLIPLKTVQ